MVLNSFHNKLLIIFFLLLLLMYHIATHNIDLGSCNDDFNRLMKDLLRKDLLMKDHFIDIRDKTTGPILEIH